ALGTSIEERGGMLCVMQRDEVHTEIRQLLGEFRIKHRRQVGIDLRAISIKSGDIERLRREITQRGGAWPALDKEALATIEKWIQDGNAAGIFEGSTITFNGQRTRLDHAEHRQVLADYDISGDTYDPVVRRLTCGWTSVLKPVLSDDASRVSLNLRIAQS